MIKYLCNRPLGVCAWWKRRRFFIVKRVFGADFTRSTHLHIDNYAEVISSQCERELVRALYERIEWNAETNSLKFYHVSDNDNEDDNGGDGEMSQYDTLSFLIHVPIGM